MKDLDWRYLLRLCIWLLVGRWIIRVQHKAVANTHFVDPGARVDGNPYGVGTSIDPDEVGRKPGEGRNLNWLVEVDRDGVILRFDFPVRSFVEFVHEAAEAGVPSFADGDSAGRRCRNRRNQQYEGAEPQNRSLKAGKQFVDIRLLHGLLGELWTI